jgi:hypothetical protein
MGGLKTIFTVLTGGYDELQEAPKFKDWDCIVFTDKPPKEAKGWKVRIIKPELSPEKESRRYKLLSHIYLSEYELVCYIDANMTLIKEPPSFPVWFSHKQRSRVYDEAKAIIQYKKANAEIIKAQVRFYLEKRFKDNNYLFQNGFFVRDHSETMNKLMELTFQIVTKYSHRDQLALPFACQSLRVLPGGLQKRNMVANYVSLNKHSKAINTERSFVHHITPARTDKNFGKAINQMIEGLPENDWICLRDIDTLPACHEIFIQQCEEIANNSQGYDLIGCMTNRLGLDYQLVNGMFDEWDIRKHREVAKGLARNGNIKGIGSSQTIGGLMMLFSKKTWLKAGKFMEGGIMIQGKFIDYYFSKAVSKVRGRMGIAEGVYLIHLYRMDAPNGETRKDINRLL